MQYCNKCHAGPLQSDYRFCPYCGKPLVEEAPREGWTVYYLWLESWSSSFGLLPTLAQAMLLHNELTKEPNDPETKYYLAHVIRGDGNAVHVLEWYEVRWDVDAQRWVPGRLAPLPADFTPSTLESNVSE